MSKTPALLHTWSDLDLLTACLWSEARGEPPDGMWAVGHVVLNRVKKKMSPTVKAAILKPKQFSWTNLSDGNRAKAQAERDAATPSFGWQLARDIAQVLLTKPPRDPTHGADHYLNVELVKRTRGKLPRWAEQGLAQGKMRAKIGQHTFLALVEKT